MRCHWRIVGGRMRADSVTKCTIHVTQRVNMSDPVLWFVIPYS
jgi:hypothetical protein